MCAEPPDNGGGIPLYLMAKAPLPGAVKTRMRPHLAPHQSAQLARLMLRQSVETARRHWPGEVALCVLPDARHPAFAQLAAEHQLEVTAQTGADLGAKMLAALQRGGARAGCAAVMGCDVPHCPGAVLATAHALLARGGNPVGPARDGGFYLLGLQRAAAIDALFNGVDWRAPATLDAVRARAATAGVRLRDLPTLRDIDHYPDLQWLAGVDAAYRPFVA